MVVVVKIYPEKTFLYNYKPENVLSMLTCSTNIDTESPMSNIYIEQTTITTHAASLRLQTLQFSVSFQPRVLTKPRMFFA